VPRQKSLSSITSPFLQETKMSAAHLTRRTTSGVHVLRQEYPDCRFTGRSLWELSIGKVGDP
jgi:hypothetical protein